MGSKIWLLLGLSVAFALFISSEVAARDLAQTATKNGDSYYNGVGGGDYNLGGARYGVGGSCSKFGGGGLRHKSRRCRCCNFRCCSAVEAHALEASTQVKPQN
ncbi:hypothetical protein POM88_052023 [Heracleum sosnowskyi]|uniref:Glycine-rich protein n=1 Tax=Heracleum sosnowskyi TaxID=360622 RepID=A0AAD8LYZ0_9APIA|nr:hypothetical protein POM88_052023 [Heracleum sosnowskyi]